MATKNKRKPYHPGRHYYAYAWILSVTYNPNHPNYDQVGGRGLTSDWGYHSYKEFEYWIETNLGPRPPDMVLNRKDKDIGFTKNNLEWATPKVRANSNTQFNVYSKYGHKNKTLSEWADELGIPYWTFRRRIAKGIPLKDIVKEFR